jgi:hypothetical protein
VDSAFYRELAVDVDGQGAGSRLAGSVASNEACGGPWSRELQHGGPPSALLVLLAERLAATASGRSDLRAVRVAAEFTRPVPVAALQLSAAVERLARSAVLVRAEIAETGRTCLQARIWLLAPGEVASAAAAAGAGEAAAGSASRPDELPDFGFDSFPYARHLQWHQVAGSAMTPGPAACWVRPRVPLLAGERYTPLQRAALIADSASGASAELDWDDWSFANVDLEVHLFRPAGGEWLLLDAITQLGAGVGFTRSHLSDLAGPVGGSMQTLLVRRVPQ